MSLKLIYVTLLESAFPGSDNATGIPAALHHTTKNRTSNYVTIFENGPKMFVPLSSLKSHHVTASLTNQQNVVGKSDDWEAAGKVPDDVYQKCARDGLLVPISGGNHIPKEWSHYPIAAGIKAEEWDGFHDFILWDELFRGAPSLSSAFIGLVSVEFCMEEGWR